MEQQTKRRLEITFAALVLIAVVVLLWFLLRPGDQGPVDVVPVVDDGSPQTTIRESVPPPGPIEVAPTTIVRTFVERLGSYSSQSDGKNIEDIADMATATLQAELLALAGQGTSDAYYGISTYVIAMNEVANDGQTATFVVTTQREESIDSPANTITLYQDIEVDLVKDGYSWLVSDYAWQ